MKKGGKIANLVKEGSAQSLQRNSFRENSTNDLTLVAC